MSESSKIKIGEDILIFIKEKNKVSVKDICKVFSLSKKDVMDVTDLYMKKELIGIEYKFTTAYFYITEGGILYIDQGIGSVDKKIKRDNGKPKEKLTILIEELNSQITSDNVEAAADTYSKIIINLNDMNDVSVIPEVLEISRIKEFLNNKLKFYFNPSNLEKPINNLIDKCKIALKADKVEESKKLYDEAFGLFATLPSDFVQYKSTIGDDLVELYKELNIRYLKILNVKAVDIDNHITELINTGNGYLEKNNFKGAFEVYSRCISVINDIPKPFLKRRMDLYNKLFEYYKEIGMKADIVRMRHELG